MRRLRRFIIFILVVVVVVSVLIVLAPTLLSLGLGKGIIAGKIEEQVNAEVSIRGVSLSWFGDQAVQGLELTDASGQKAAQLDVELRTGLWDLLFNAPASYDATLAGSIQSQLRKDGSLSITDVITTSPEPEVSPPEPKPPVQLTGVPALKINIEALKVTMHDDELEQDIVLEDVTGQLDYTPGGTLKVKMDCATRSGDLAGSVDLKSSAEKLFDSQGKFTPAGASFAFELTLESVPVPLSKIARQLSDARLTAETDNLADHLTLRIDAHAILHSTESNNEGETATNDGAASSLIGSLTATNLWQDDGTWSFSPDSLTGELEGHSIPTGLLQPALAGTGIILTRDLGELADIHGKSTDEWPREITLNIQSEQTDINLNCTVNQDRNLIVGKKLHVRGPVHPGLYAAYAEETGTTLASMVNIDFSATEFSVPLKTDEDDIGADWENMRASGTVEINEQAVVYLPKDEPADSAEQDTIQGRLGRIDFGLENGTITCQGNPEVSATIASDTLAEWVNSNLDDSQKLTIENERVTAGIQFTKLNLPINISTAEDTTRVDVQEIDAQGTLEIAEPVTVHTSLQDTIQCRLDKIDFRLADGTVSCEGNPEVSAVVTSDTIEEWANLNLDESQKLTIENERVTAGIQFSKLTLPVNISAEENTNPVDLQDIDAQGTLEVAEPIIVHTSLLSKSDPPRQETVELRTGNLTFDLSQGILQCRGAPEAIANLTPQTFADWTQVSCTDETVAVGVTLTHLNLPLTSEDSSDILPALGLDGQLRSNHPIHVTHVGENEIPLTIQNIVVSIDSDKISDGVHNTATITLEENGVIEFDETVTGLFDDQNQFSVTDVVVSGTVTGRNLPGKRIRDFIPLEDSWVDELLDGPVNCSIVSKYESDDRQSFTLGAQGPFGSIDSVLNRDGNSVLIASAQANLNATRKLCRRLQKAQDKPWLPADTASVRMSLREPYLLKFVGEEEKKLDLSEPLKAKLNIDDVVLAISAVFEEPAGVRGLQADVDAVLDEPIRFHLMGAGALYRPSSRDQGVTNVAYDLRGRFDPEGMTPLGQVELKEINTRHAEEMLGYQPGTFSEWIGDNGNITTRFAKIDDNQGAFLETKFTNLTGTFRARTNEEMILLAAETKEDNKPRLTVTREKMSKVLGLDPQPNPGKASVHVFKEVPLQVQHLACRIPQAAINGEPFDPAKAQVVAVVIGGPLILASAPKEWAAIKGMKLDITSRNLKEGVTFSLIGKAADVDHELSGELKLEGNITGLVDDKSTLQLANGMARFDAESEIWLSTPIRRALLENVNLIFEDVRSSRQPVRLSFTQVEYPLDNDMSKLQADVKLTVGSVEVDQKASMFSPLSIFNRARSNTIPGCIEPLEAEIRNGLITYKKCNITLGEMCEGDEQTQRSGFFNRRERSEENTQVYHMSYEGTMDLVSRRVDLHTVVPLYAAAYAVKTKMPLLAAIGIDDLIAEAGDVPIPVVTTGTFENHNTTIELNEETIAKILLAVPEGIIKEVPGVKIPPGVKGVLDILNKGKKGGGG